MKKLLICLAIFFSGVRCYSGILQDSTEVTGWMIFIYDDVFFLPSQINSNSKPEEFFENKEYNNGLLVTSFVDALKYKALAKIFKVKSGTHKVKARLKVLRVNYYSFVRI